MIELEKNNPFTGSAPMRLHIPKDMDVKKAADGTLYAVTPKGWRRITEKHKHLSGLTPRQYRRTMRREDWRQSVGIKAVPA